MNDMRSIIYSLPNQIGEAINIFNCAWSDVAQKNIFSGYYGRILICGMGGSGISGDIVSNLYPQLDIIVNKDYQIPEYVDSNTLAILVSYSGNTEETLYNYRILQKKGIPIVAISSDGRLLKNKALMKIKIPPGFPPRGALGYLFTPIPLLLYRAGLIKKNPEAQLSKLSIFLRKQSKILDKKGKELAKAVFKKFPIIYANSNAFGIVAKRWQCQLNENSKILCHVNIIPEMNHNEIVGLPAPINSRAVLLFHNDPGAFYRNSLRVRVIKEIIDRELKGIKYIDINPAGKNTLEQVFWTIMLGDFLSYHLALMRKVDPLPVKRIDYLKNRLKDLI
ncbi:MAG: bifunctional phosphoglucose/phosphomannose isomerase [candidate division WOR-3 bacterium]|nr:bifunctional phosphoglucose/phosphomannose isomerase [candidate division WOR-3 bacterium]